MMRRRRREGRRKRNRKKRERRGGYCSCRLLLTAQTMTEFQQGYLATDLPAFMTDLTSSDVIFDGNSSLSQSYIEVRWKISFSMKTFLLK